MTQQLVRVLLPIPVVLVVLFRELAEERAQGERFVELD